MFGNECENMKKKPYHKQKWILQENQILQWLFDGIHALKYAKRYQSENSIAKRNAFLKSHSLNEVFSVICEYKIKVERILFQSLHFSYAKSNQSWKKIERKKGTQKNICSHS